MYICTNMFNRDVMRTLLIVLTCFVVFVSCGKQNDNMVEISTPYGTMRAVLYDDTPIHKKNFLRLVEAGEYDSLLFHRVIRGFMIQGGDPNSRHADRNTKLGVSEIGEPIPSEIVYPKYFHKRGALVAARKPDSVNPEKMSSGSQFYIVQGMVYDELELSTDMRRLQQTFMKFVEVISNKHLMEEYSRLYQEGDFKGMNRLMLSQRDEMESFFNTSLRKNVTPEQLKAYTSIGGTPHLDGEYTVFGKIIKGFDVAEEIASETTSGQDVPIDPIYMIVTVEEKLKKDITEEFGYIYPTENE